MEFIKDFYNLSGALLYRIFGRERIIFSRRGFRLKGYLIWRIEDRDGWCEIELCSIRVISKERRKGYGAEMVRKLEGIAKKKGKRSIYLFVDNTNEDAQGFYKKNGFQEVSNLEEFFPKAKMFVRKI